MKSPTSEVLRAVIEQLLSLTAPDRAVVIASAIVFFGSDVAKQTADRVERCVTEIDRAAKTVKR